MYSTYLCIDTPTIDHLFIWNFVTGPARHRLVIDFAYISWICMNAQNKVNTVLFD